MNITADVTGMLAILASVALVSVGSYAAGRRDERRDSAVYRAFYASAMTRNEAARSPEEPS